MILEEQKLPSLHDHVSAPGVARSVVFYVVFCRSVFALSSFVFFAIVMSVLGRFMAPDYPIDIFFYALTWSS